MEGFQINYTDLSDLFWEYKRKIENLIENIDNCIEKINMFTENAVFTGKTGDAVKSYLGEAHITILSGIKVTAQTLLDNMAAYKDGYRAIDSSTNFKLDEEAIQEFRKKLASNYEDTDEYMGKIRSMLDGADVVWQSGELGKVDAGGGGTVAMYLAALDIDVVDLGVPVLSMHAPFEVVSKLDVYMAYRAFKTFFEEK